MRYIDAGYAICLGVLALYAVVLVARRRRLQRAVELAETPVEALSEAPASASAPAPRDQDPRGPQAPSAAVHPRSMQ